MNFDLPNANPVVPPLPPASVLFLEASLKDALKRGDAAACRRIAEQAGESWQTEMFALLCELLVLPSRRKQRRKRRGAEWDQARAAAATALGRMGSCHALPRLARALFDPADAVRTAAGEALQSAGDAAVMPLIAQLSMQGTWTVPSMGSLVALLGHARNREATAALLRTLDGELPRSASRWNRVAYLYPLWAVGLPILTVMCYAAGSILLDPYAGGHEPVHVRLLMVAATLFLGALFAAIPTGFVWLILHLFLGRPARASVERKERNALAAAAAHSLQQIGDKYTLSRLLAACRSGNTQKRTAAKRAVASLLPRLDPSDMTWLRPDDRQHLNWLLQSTSPDVVVAVLRALRQVGTGQELPPVRRLAERGATEAIRAEACETLPILEQRQAQAKASASLLRASKSPTPAGNTLLRAATAQPETPAAQLLRPLE